MKAWAVTDKIEQLYTTIVFAETRGRAIAIAQNTDTCADLSFTEIKATRVPALDQFYRGWSEMNWYNTDDRVAMVRYGGIYCDEADLDDCNSCPAKKWCSRYEDLLEEQNG